MDSWNPNLLFGSVVHEKYQCPVDIHNVYTALQRNIVMMKEYTLHKHVSTDCQSTTLNILILQIKNF